MRSILKSLFGGGTSASIEEIKPGDQVVIADGRGVLRNRGGRMSPRDQIDALQILSRLAQRESLPMVAFFEGEPLRKVEDGGKFDNVVTVHYAATEDELRSRLLKQVQDQRRRNPVVVTADRKLEEQVSAQGATVMRPATLVRALSAGQGDGFESGARGGDPRGGEGREGREGRPPHPRHQGRNQGRHERRPRPPQPHPEGLAPAAMAAEPGPAEAPPGEAAAAPAAEPQDQAPQSQPARQGPPRRDSVNELIDLV